MLSNKAVFLDKDGTLVEDVPYNVDPDRVTLTQGAIAGLQLLQAAGYALIVISNQAGIARGYFSESELHQVEQHLRSWLAEQEIFLTGFYYCPHHPDGIVEPYAVLCNCRKPQPGLLHKAALVHQVYLPQSWFIGDILNDVEAGRSAGCRTILIDNGNETEWELSPQRLPHHVVPNLADAARIILAIDQSLDSPFPPGDQPSAATPSLTHP